MASQHSEHRPPPDVIIPTAEDLEEVALEADLEAGTIGPSQMLRGSLLFAAGAAVALLSFFSNGSFNHRAIYVAAFGVAMGGLADLVKGFSNWRRGKHAQSRDKGIVPQ